MPTLALFGADYTAWQVEQTPETLAPLMEALDTAAAALLEFQRGVVDSDFRALAIGQPLVERPVPRSAESYLLIAAADHVYARCYRPEHEHHEPAQRFACYLAEHST